MPLFDSLLFLADEVPHSASLNMAIDEVILKESSVPTLRIYRWEKNAVSFGYFEKYNTVSAMHGGRELVRRWTGGGVVPHGEDYTYSLIVPAGSPFLLKRAAETYMDIHASIVSAMRESGISASLATSAAPKMSQACFENAVAHDILLDHRKIAGAAQRRTRSGLLHQGSIQYPGLPGVFGEKLAASLAHTVTLLSVSQNTLDAARNLAAGKYATDAWLRKF